MATLILVGDCRDVLKTEPDESVHCVVTSPPYFGLRDYGVDGQIGLEASPGAFVDEMVSVFREVRRVLKADATLWLNLGDSYAANQSNNGGYSAKSTLAGFTNPNTKGRRANDSAVAHRISHGLKPKDLVGIPWRVAFALQSDGWWLRQDIIWSKPNPMPESVTDRCTKAHEYLFMLSKSERYYYDAEAIKEPAVSDHQSGNGFKRGARLTYQDADGTARGNDRQWIDVGGSRNKRSVWTVPTDSYPGAHFATFPPALIEPCILAGCPEGGTVLDPFFGAGTTGLVADRLKRNCIGVELNPSYAEMAERRIRGDGGMFAAIEVV